MSKEKKPEPKSENVHVTEERKRQDETENNRKPNTTLRSGRMK